VSDHRVLHVEPDNRVGIIAMTGGGKTYLAKKLMAGKNNIVVVDSKHTFTFGSGGRFDHRLSLADLKKWNRDGIAIYRPTDEEAQEYCAAFWRWAWSAAPLCVYCDEITQLAPNAINVPFGLKKAIVLGREKKLSVWYASQRPSGIPIILLSEIEVTFAGLMKNPKDRDKIAQFTGNPEIRELVPQYTFWYCNALDNVAFKMNANEIVRKVPRNE
jgi:hypothetical protein